MGLSKGQLSDKRDRLFGDRRATTLAVCMRGSILQFAICNSDDAELQNAN
jgi:hypothetical protein